MSSRFGSLFAEYKRVICTAATSDASNMHTFVDESSGNEAHYTLEKSLRDESMRITSFH